MPDAQPENKPTPQPTERLSLPKLKGVVVKREVETLDDEPEESSESEKQPVVKREPSGTARLGHWRRRT